jgi:Domain of unknown function (DUF4157)
VRWPFGNRSETRSKVAVAAAPADTPAPPPATARASGRDWVALPVLKPTIVTRPATTTDTQSFASSLAMTRPMVHVFEPRYRSSAGPSGTITDAADVRVLPTPSSPQLLHQPSDLPRIRLRKAPAASMPTSIVEAIRVDAVPAPVRSPDPEPEPEIDDDAAPAVVESVEPVELTHLTPDPTPDATPERTRRVRPNLGQSRRLGLGTPVSRLPEDVVPQDVRDDIQAAYGVDVSDTVIRRDDDAAREAREVGATAFARGGEEVVLPADLGPLDQPAAKGMLAHELTHVAQQRVHGTSLPDEMSDAGRALEAAARAAEQRFRGDANAPSLEQSMRDEVKQWLSTGVAEQNDDGQVVFLPRSLGPTGVQRAPTGEATTDYSWQTEWMKLHHPEAVKHDFFGRPSDEELEARGAANEARFIWPELVRFREDYRQDEWSGTGKAGEAEARRRFQELPAARPAPHVPDKVTEELDAKQQAALDEARGLQARLAEAHEKLEHEKQEIERWNKAVKDVDRRFPLRDFSKDDKAHLKPLPELPDDAQAAEKRLDTLRTDYPKLAHYFPVSTNHPVQSPHPEGGTPPTISGGTVGAGSSLSHDSFMSVPSHIPGIGTHLPSGPGGGTTDTSTGSDISWEAGVFTKTALGRAGLGTLGSIFGSEPTAAELEQNAQEQEQTHIGELRRLRSQRFHELATAKANEVQRELFQKGRHVPSEAEAKQLITASEWQTVIAQVETEMPLSVHQLTDANRLIADHDNSQDLIDLIDKAPTSRDDPAPGGDAGATPPTKATGTPPAAPGAAPAVPATRGTGAASPAGTAGAETAQAAHAPAHGEHPLLTGMVAGALGGAMGSELIAAAERHHEGYGSRAIQEHEIDLSPEMLNRLTTELYPMLRSRLRTEFIVDRERTGLLPDFR